jgi:hypothetical protein
MSFGGLSLSAAISISAATCESGAVIQSPYYSRSSEKASDSDRSTAPGSGASSWSLSFEWSRLTYIDVTSAHIGSSSIPVSADEVVGVAPDSAPGVDHAHARHEYESTSRTELRTSQRTVLITGAAGFVRMHLSKQLMSQGVKVVGLDNLNTHFYHSTLKQDRLAQLLMLTSSCTSTLRSSPSSPSNSKYRVARQPSNPSVDCGCN